MLTENHATETDTNYFTVSTKNWDLIEWELSDMGIEYETDDNIHTIHIGKSDIVIETKSRSRKPTEKQETTETESHGVKSKNNGYIVVYKSKTDKNEKTNKSLTTCSEIKSWLKTIEKKSMEYLRIYDTLKNPCRLSAWIER